MNVYLQWFVKHDEYVYEQWYYKKLVHENSEGLSWKKRAIHLDVKVC